MSNGWSHPPNEDQLRDIHHTAHRDGAREAFWVLALICGGGFVLLFQSGLEGFFFYAVGAIISTIGAVAAMLTMRWIGGIAMSERETLATEQREAARREREKQLAEFRAHAKPPKDPRTMPGPGVVE